MIETAFDQLRFTASITFGIPFSAGSLERLVRSLRQTYEEFGSANSDGDTGIMADHRLDDATRHEMQLARFRSQATRAALETRYYRTLFNRLGFNPKQLTYEDLSRIPFTPKTAVRNDPDAFLCQSATPYMHALTTGTTGLPTMIAFSDHELRVYAALSAISLFSSKEVTASDIVQISTTSRGTLGNISLAGACAHIGASVSLAGVTDPEYALKLLTRKQQILGKKSRTSILSTYPSYLGELIECGLRLGYKPKDFGLERILAGGEILTEGLQARCRELFGPARVIDVGYGMTEIWPLGGRSCEQGHLHFEVSQGLVEVYNFAKGRPARKGEFGTIIATPFPPYRETTLLLRYDTQDVVRVLAKPPTCSLRYLPATSHLFGKLPHAVAHDKGWTFPRQVVEALESFREVPLPARYGFWAVPGGVAVEVVTKDVSLRTRRILEESLAKHSVPVQELFLREHRDQLHKPMLLRGDLREAIFYSSV